MCRLIVFFKLIMPQFYRQTSALFLWALMIFAAWFFGFHIEYNEADSKILNAYLLGRDATIVEVKDYYNFFFSFLVVISIFVISKVQSLFILGEITPIILSSGTSRSSLLFSILFATFFIILIPYVILELVIWASVSMQSGKFLWNPIIPVLSLAAIFFHINIMISALLLITSSRTSTTIFSIVFCFVAPVILDVKTQLLYPLFDEHFFPSFIDTIDVLILSIPTFIGQTHNAIFDEPLKFNTLSMLIIITALWTIASFYALLKKKY